MSYHQAEEAFRDWAAECGFPCLPDVLAEGSIQRFHVDGDRHGSRNGYYRFQVFPDGGAAGTVGSWKTDEQYQWRYHGGQAHTRRPSPLEVQQREQERREREAQQAAVRAEEYAEALHRMRLEWHRAPYADDRHAYCRAKGVTARPYRAHALRLGSRGELLVPAYTFVGASGWRLELRSFQRIPPDGKEKRNAKGCSLKGLFYPFGKPSPRELSDEKRPLVLAEGWATAATVYQALGFDAAEPWQVLCCFGAGNLLAVAREAHAREPKRPIVVAADDDEAGRKAAMETAREVGGGVALPCFHDGCRRTAKDTDFNDLARLSPDGIEAVLRCIEAPFKGDGSKW